jgi:hypothetical protein
MEKIKKLPTSFSLSEDTLVKLRLLADKESRKQTNYIELLIQKAFAESGLSLPKPKPPRK